MPDPAYGYRYQLQRAAAWAALPDGTQCQICGLPMFKDRARNPDGRSLHWDHITPVADGELMGLRGSSTPAVRVQRRKGRSLDHQRHAARRPASAARHADRPEGHVQPLVAM
jgi:hypothetical protein